MARNSAFRDSYAPVAQTLLSGLLVPYESTWPVIPILKISLIFEKQDKRTLHLDCVAIPFVSNF